MIRWKDKVEDLRNYGKNGFSIADVARSYGVSRQRAKQVVDKYVPEWKYTYGKAMRKEDADLRAIQKRKYRQFRKTHPDAPPFTEINWLNFCPVLDIELDYFAEEKQDSSVCLEMTCGAYWVISLKAAIVLRTTTAPQLRALLFFAENT